MIKEKNYKGIKAIELDNECITVTVIPELGGKIASIFFKPKRFELLFGSANYRTPKLYDNFANFDASGFDDAFPSINCEEVEVGDRKITYPDHGEVWSMSFDYSIKDNSLILSSKSDILPYLFKKSITIDNTEITVSYDIKNIEIYAFPCIYTMHCLLNCREDMQFFLPKTVKKIENVIDSNLLGKIGTMHNFPETTTLNGDVYRLDRVFPKSALKCEKYYVKDEIINGVCGVYYPTENVYLSILFDTDTLPYLGFWVTEGGFRGDYNCALEPSNGYYDSISVAKENHKLFTLHPEQSLKFDIKLRLSDVKS
jgi:galactose mutarotase-like enzyme